VKTDSSRAYERDAGRAHTARSAEFLNSPLWGNSTSATLCCKKCIRTHTEFFRPRFVPPRNPAARDGTPSRASRRLLQKMNPIPGKSIITDDEYLQQNAGP
jgi:hypothetical protein